MSTNSRSGDFLRLHAGAPARVRSGSPVRLLLLCAPNKPNVPGAARALLKRHLRIREAKTVAERLFDEGRVVVEIPAVESLGALRSEPITSSKAGGLIGNRQRRF
jgi:hypothetical protein